MDLFKRFGLVMVTLLALASFAPAADTEVRTFAATIDGRPAGTYRMTYTPGQDGSETIVATADIRLRVAIVTYTFTLRSKEVWKNGKLVAVESMSVNDGKKMTVSAAAGDMGIIATINGKPNLVRADAVTSTGWKLPDPKAAAVTQFDIEDGKETACKMESLGGGKVMLNGTAIEGQRVKLTGRNVDNEWWFDAAGKPIHQVLIVDKHRIVLTLTEISR